MPWVRFSAPFDFQPRPRMMQHYPAGWEGSVTTACYEAANARGLVQKRKPPAGTKLDKAGRTYLTDAG